MPSRASRHPHHSARFDLLNDAAAASVLLGNFVVAPPLEASELRRSVNLVAGCFVRADFGVVLDYLTLHRK